jgi:arginyl-tRNA synthetase
MALTQQQQKNAEKLIDEHFGALKDAVNQALAYREQIEVEVTPELEALASARAEELNAEREAENASLAKFTEDVKSLGFAVKDVRADPYRGTTTAEHLIRDIVNQVRSKGYEERRNALNDAWTKISEAHSEARRKVLIATLTDASEANALIQALPGLDSFLPATTEA